jgi:hypothetical protein
MYSDKITNVHIHVWIEIEPFLASTAFEIGSVDVDPSLDAFAVFLEAASFFFFVTNHWSPSSLGAWPLGPK